MKVGMRKRIVLNCGPDLSYSAYRKPLEDLRWTKEFSGNLRKEVSEMRLPENTILKPVFLLLGSSSAGKSAFVNALSSISKRRISNPAVAAKSASSQITTVYRRIETVSGELQNYILSDIMGVSVKDEIISHIENIKLLLKGQVKPGFNFNIKESIKEGNDYYISTPVEEDKTQCVIFVVDCSKPINADMQLFRDISKLNEEINELGIPSIALLTKVDQVSSSVKADIRNIYHSKSVNTKINELAEVTGIPISNIHPIKNYAEEQIIDDMIDIPLLIALKRAFDFAVDYLEQQQVRGLIVRKQEQK